MVFIYQTTDQGLPLGTHACRTQSLPMRGDLPGMVADQATADGPPTPVVPFAGVAEAYREIDEHPERSIKLGVSF